MSRIWLIDTRHQRDLTRFLAKKIAATKSLKGLNQKTMASRQARKKWRNNTLSKRLWVRTWITDSDYDLAPVTLYHDILRNARKKIRCP